MKKRQGFTLIELLIVIAIIAIVAAVIFTAVDPLRRFADARNANRWNAVGSIVTAVKLHDVDHGINSFPGIDGSLRMIGTASSGCSVVCSGEEIAVLDRDDYTDKFARGFEWFLHPKIAYAAPISGWVSPTGFTDSASQWTNENYIYDNNVGTYASNNYGGSGWGQFIELTLSTPITSNKVRINADYLDAHINYVDIDVYVDGNWVDVFQGGNEASWNVQWVELPFTQGTVEKARFRWNYKVGGYYYWLYEFQFYQAADEVSLPICGLAQTNYIDESRAILQGAVDNDGGDPVEYRFQYGLSTSYNYSTDWTGDKVSGENFQEMITGLDGGTTYYYRVQLRNTTGTISCDGENFTTASEGASWLLPNSSSGSWENKSQSFDSNLTSYARLYHNINDPAWGDYIYFNHSPVYYDQLKFYALGNSEVNGIDVDIYKNGEWEDVYQGSFSDRSWVQLSFDEGQVTQSRIRFSTPYTTHGFFWQLYEYQMWRTENSQDINVTEESCVDIADNLSNYIPVIPVDPKYGSEERTYYAIKRENNNRKITVMACGAENGEEIKITK
ncbi:MAG: prepilin-type N-terminal cleavage/methylation domain-containing protein [Candidatus Magasanikbacteria bacterium]|nr:prepilin-type N-terminal cleavage/methylation domain-containing protein [Candidatus Magasanikbacteria bacterium]